MKRPELTGIIIIGNRRQRGDRAVESLLRQDTAGALECLVVDLGDAGQPPLECAARERVTVLRPARRMTLGEAKLEAIRAARAPLVAFLEEHSRAFPGYSEALLVAFDERWDGVGPEVHNGNPGFGLSDAMMVANYAQWMAPAPKGDTDNLPGNNSAYRRNLLLRYETGLARLLTSDRLLQLQLLDDGCRLGIDPAARISHITETTWGSSVAGAFHWNRCIADQRFAGWSAGKRIAFAAGSLVAPWRRTLQTLVQTSRRDPGYRAQAVRSAAVVLFVNYAAFAGQVAGAFRGKGESEHRFTHLELNGLRPGPENYA